MGFGVVAQRKLQHMLEIHGSHGLVLAVRETVGMERDQRAADNDEKTKPDPSADEHHQIRPGQVCKVTLRNGKGIDDASEQDWFNEHGGGERQIGDCQNPAKTGFAAEQLEHPDIEADKFHAFGTGCRCLCVASIDPALGGGRQKRCIKRVFGFRLVLERVDKRDLLD